MIKMIIHVLHLKKWASEVQRIRILKNMSFPIFTLVHLLHVSPLQWCAYLKLLRSILEEEMGRGVMKQSSDFICCPFSETLEKVELAGAVAEAYFTQGRAQEGAKRTRRRRRRRVEVNQPWHCITLGWKVKRPTQDTLTKLGTWSWSKSRSKRWFSCQRFFSLGLKIKTVYPKGYIKTCCTSLFPE